MQRTTPPELWVLVGGNGSGKSTFYRSFLAKHGLPLINADLIAARFFPDNPEANSYQAALLAARERDRVLASGQSFCYETVFSHPSKIDFIARAKALGYMIKVFAFHVSGTELNLARISQRIREGGHSVPEDKVRTRIPRTLGHIQKVVPLCDELFLFDNSSAERPYQLVAAYREHRWDREVSAAPAWARPIIEREG
ncbi:AAA family ATPase [Marinobacter sp. chi1]|uniref:AAA family ATPase n=1 Tax=Marinobacter suaedae TaxID=3057675 RepID=A0ABT8VW40_9GAMM|nr:AAA family ATPase [Marinobacter sp. chi1]MDO3720158.1 AAA family ATPase [Marinobacter sp. chi1]